MLGFTYTIIVGETNYVKLNKLIHCDQTCCPSFSIYQKRKREIAYKEDQAGRILIYLVKNPSDIPIFNWRKGQFNKCSRSLRNPFQERLNSMSISQLSYTIINTIFKLRLSQRNRSPESKIAVPTTMLTTLRLYLSGS